MTTESWRERASCARHPRPQLFDGWLDRESHAEANARHVAALALCRGCPVVDRCLAAAEGLKRRGKPVEGVWGGRLFEQLHVQEKRRADERHDIGHGTEGGYKAHKRRREDACNACHAAAVRAWQHRYARRKRAS